MHARRWAWFGPVLLPLLVACGSSTSNPAGGSDASTGGRSDSSALDAFTGGRDAPRTDAARNEGGPEPDSGHDAKVATGVKWHPGNYASGSIVTSSSQLSAIESETDTVFDTGGSGNNILGYVLIISWDMLEDAESVYTFSF